MFKTIKEDVQEELIEKKSKFIANVFYVTSVEQAEKKIKQLRKKYYDARHNCYAYSVCEDGNIINRFSDDGEPSGTAGAPMLNIINKKEISNVLVVVTRYFGGILLGTGGLVRAYSIVTQNAFDKIEFVIEEYGMEYKLEIKYSELEAIKYYAKMKNIKISNIEYSDTIKCILEINEDEKIELEKNINDMVLKVENNHIVKHCVIRR